MKTRSHARSPDKKLVSLSMDEDLYRESMEYAKSIGLPWSAFVRMLIIKDVRGKGGERTPTSSVPANVTAAKGTDGKRAQKCSGEGCKTSLMTSIRAS